MYQAITITLNPAIDQTLTIPGFKAGSVNRVQQVRSNAGGKGVNVASALAGYGLTAAATGFLGEENSVVFKELFDRKRIADKFIRISGSTRTGIKISNPTEGETTDINFPGSAPAQKDVEALWRKITELSSLDPAHFVLAGSLPPGVDPAIYHEMIKTLHDRNHVVVLDTSGDALRFAAEAAPEIMKPNIHELEELTGRTLTERNEITEAARDLINRGTRLVAVSMGIHGSVFVTSDEAVLAMPPSVQVRSTVGAGDAMVAGIVAAELQGLPLADCARLATAFSVELLAHGEVAVNSKASIHTSVQFVKITKY